MPTNRAVTGYNGVAGLRGILVQTRARGVAWAKIGESFPSVKIGTLKRIAFDETYTPKRADICHALRLPITAPAVVCSIHGVVHKGRCPRKTFEENAAAYESWKQKNAGKLAGWIAWAELSDAT